MPFPPDILPRALANKAHGPDKTGQPWQWDNLDAQNGHIRHNSHHRIAGHRPHDEWNTMVFMNLEAIATAMEDGTLKRDYNVVPMLTKNGVVYMGSHLPPKFIHLYPKPSAVEDRPDCAHQSMVSHRPGHAVHLDTSTDVINTAVRTGSRFTAHTIIPQKLEVGCPGDAVVCANT